MAKTQHAILDVVELLAESGRWPARTVDTVVEANDDLALVEISDDRGHALDFISVPHMRWRRNPAGPPNASRPDPSDCAARTSASARGHS
jgi:hypothetical protein